MADVKTIAENILLEIGGNPGNKGFAYTVSAIEVIKEDVEGLNYTTHLYIEVARRHKTTTSRVERAIHHMKETIAVGGNLEKFEKYFPARDMKFTNSEFLGTLYIRVNQILREKENNAD